MALNEQMSDPEVRKAFEEEILVDEATETVSGLLASLGLSQKELASRLGVSAGRVSQILSGENLTLHSLANLGWALGIRFELQPVVMADRAGTPAEHDPAAPAWLSKLRPNPAVRFSPVPRCGERPRLDTAYRVRAGRVA